MTGASEGSQQAEGICPQGTALLEFRNNVAHSNGRYGLRLYDNQDGWYPRHDPCSNVGPNNRYKQMVFEGLFTYRNKVNGVQISRVASLVMKGFTVVDQGERGFEMPGAQGGLLLGPWGETRIEETLIVGTTAESDGSQTTGRRLGGAAGGIRMGIEAAAWHRLIVQNTTFANFAAPNTAAVTGIAKEGFTPRGGGWETRFQGISWVNAPRRTRWRHTNENIFLDLDGSFSGQRPMTSVVAHNSLLSDVRAFPECIEDERYSGGGNGHRGLLCRGLKFVRVALNGALPRTALQYIHLVVRQSGAARGTFVTADDAAYLVDKWRPAGDIFLVQMDPAARTLAPMPVGTSRWISASGSWLEQGTGSQVSTLSVEFVDRDSSGLTRRITRHGNLTADGTQLVWNDGFPPWTSCRMSPEDCVGPTRYTDVPTMRVQYHLKRRTHPTGYEFVVPVNRLYEMEFDLAENDRVDVTNYTFGVGELEEDEWIALRSAPSVQIPNHLRVSTDGAGLQTRSLGRLPVPSLDATPAELRAALGTLPSALSLGNASSFVRHQYASASSAGALTDLVGTADLSLAGGAVLGSTTAAAAVFDGITAHAASPAGALATLVGTAAITVEAWVRVVGDVVGHGKLVSLQGGTGEEVAIWSAHSSGSGSPVLKLEYHGNWLAASTRLGAGVHHIAATLSPDGCALYVDGALATETTRSDATFAAFAAAPTMTLFGDGASSTTHARGELYGLTLYAGVLPAEEISGRYEHVRPDLPAQTTDWYRDDNGTTTGTILFRGPPACAYNDWDPCIFEGGRFIETSCPVDNPGCQYDSDGEDGDRVRLKWSNPTTWNGTDGCMYGGVPPLDCELPGDGDNVTIEKWMDVQLDVSPPRLHSLEIFGALDIKSNGSSFALQAVHITVREGGNFTVGSEATPFEGTFEIALSGDRYTKGPRFNTHNYGAKTLLVFGSLRMHARVPTPPWTKLNHTAPAGATTLVVLGSVDWKVGDEIIVPSTDYEPGHAEEVTLTAVHPLTVDGVPFTALSIDAPLAHSHFAAVETHGGKQVEMRGEVGHLSRDIVIRGTDIDEDARFRSLYASETGATVIVTTYAHYGRSGRTVGSGDAGLIGVRFRQAGVHGYDDRPALGFFDLSADNERDSYVRGCVFSQVWNVGLQINMRYTGLLVQSNVFAWTLGSNLRAFSGGNTYEDNLGVSAVTRLTYRGRESRSSLGNVEWADYCANFDIAAGPNVVRNNIAAGSERIGFKLSTPPTTSCEASPCSRGSCFEGNLAHSAQLGFALHFSGIAGCVKVDGFTVWRAWTFGIWGNTEYSIIHWSNLTVVDSKVGFYWGMGGPPGISHTVADPMKKVIVSGAHASSAALPAAPTEPALAACNG